MLSQAGDIKVATTRSFLPPITPAHQLTPADMFKKIINRDALLLSNFKEIGVRLILTSSRNNSSEGTASPSKLEPNSSNYYDLNSDSPSLASTR